MSEITQEDRSKLYHFIESNMTIYDDDIEFVDSTNIFTSGFVSSIFAMRLLSFLENEFSITVPDEDIVISNFSSINKMCEMVSRLKTNEAHA
jgi:acyl carrier protein